MSKEFKILSIDGGGIRGLFPAQFLSEIEAQIEKDTGEKIRTCDYFDLICGTSTGGILALALSLGFSASEISELYLKYAKGIFGRKLFNPLRSSIFFPKHSSKFLETLIKNTFSSKFDNKDPIIDNCYTRICIPVYDIKMGQLNVIKTRHHEKLIRDWQIPVYQVAMATAAAPTYFSPYTLSYKGVSNKTIVENNKLDGGVCINNPVMVGYIEALNTLKIEPENLKILSIGTGVSRFSLNKSTRGWGILRWMMNTRLIDLFMQSQADVVDNQIKFFNQGVGKSTQLRFVYTRIQHEFQLNKDSIAMDEFRTRKLRTLIAAAQDSFKKEGISIIDDFYKNKITPYKHGKL